MSDGDLRLPINKEPLNKCWTYDVQTGSLIEHQAVLVYAGSSFDRKHYRLPIGVSIIE